MSIFTSYFKLTAEYRWMLIAAFVFNLGFYMLIPFLAGYLKQDLLLSATLVGVVLGVRSFCQQGLFLVGGLLADLFGEKKLIVIGCLLRALGFCLFLFSDVTAILFLAAFLTGFAGALFTPAAQAYFSKQQVLSRAQMFSLVGVARNGGELLGPVCGLLLLNISFDILCIVSALPFAMFAVVFTLLIPQHQKQQQSDQTNASSSSKQGGVKAMVAGVLSNREFLKFSAVMAGYFMLINQISFAIPMHIVNQQGAPQDVAWVLTLCALISIFLQFPVTKLCERWLSPKQWISIGIALMGVSFLTLIPSWPYSQGVLYYLPLSLLAVIFTVGTMVSFPFIMSQISELAKDKSVATHYGFFYLFAGVGLIAGSSVVGVAFDLSNINEHLAWYCLIFIGLITAILNTLLMSSATQEDESQTTSPSTH
ncbi:MULTISPECIES: MFS transporter [Pseudoalteromonas]|uniref:Cyanate permease n=1 Tax=Pseudoalteromonas luteoviolacea (strain 2ta16) TaxID=1353533 RepID=V4HLI2_PSEL2|nr:MULTISPECIES: MFS transporter [Pseudoalteromonas]ESP90638.1 Cyanate permease [Pseudoalteromonas luteoviolacea 2ta16]KZN41786.1 transporter [Pseudoalteromonas luteoviolacea NCIMB 1944]MCG7548055.1 MFS transporter [Pseudoalteromonas sp. Of7M-16]